MTIRVFSTVSQAASHTQPSVVTLGKFDGVHAGHRGIIEQLTALARSRGERSVVVTFDRHPLEVLRPGSAPSLLVSNAQRIRAFEQLGVDAVLMLRFTPEVAAMEPRAFVSDVLSGALGATDLVVGRDARFGHRGGGDIALLQELAPELHYTVHVHDDICDDDGERASSTRIRAALDAGDIEGAAKLLGRYPAVESDVVHGMQRGRELGFPTANLAPETRGYVPADGVYAGWLTVDGESYRSAISVGTNPHFGDVEQRQIEAHVIDEQLDLYDRLVSVTFAKRLRGELKFDSLDALIAQMHRDVEVSREFLAEHPLVGDSVCAATAARDVASMLGS